MVFLILESLGSTELGFILVMALVFFGPRKLPQISRTLGKNLASFRRASEDFKRTWDSEVNLEELNLSRLDLESTAPMKENSILNNEEPSQASPPATAAADGAVPRESTPALDKGFSSGALKSELVQPLSKQDWL